MNNFQSSTISNLIMQTFLKKKLLIYREVLDTLDKYHEFWADDASFCKAVRRLREVSEEEGLDLYLADNILKYTLDFKMFSYRKRSVVFFQEYFRARVMAKKELAR